MGFSASTPFQRFNLCDVSDELYEESSETRAKAAVCHVLELSTLILRAYHY